MMGLVYVILALSICSSSTSTDLWSRDADEFTTSTAANITKLKDTIQSLARQMMMDRFTFEQQTRTSGNSGIKQIRAQHDGTYNFHTASYAASSVASIHEHANNIRTVGMGEFEAVLNGVEFRTRHNDYRLYMPHPTSSEYHATAEIPFPDVPSSVTSKTDINDQIVEMREWFKAFRDQDDSVRDYKKHFKPILCYMEGAWNKANDELEESFHSDRHFIDAKSWFDLQRKNMFIAASGSKSKFENLATLPTSIYGFTEEGLPKYAQWNYRIVCHPLKRDLPVNRLALVEDLGIRMRNKNSMYRHLHSRAARFQINPMDSDTWVDKKYVAGLLDELMEEIPGLDNYQGNITATDLDSNRMLNLDGSEKDVSRYHRWYRMDGRDAMGLQDIHRSFSDSYMFSAMTTQEKIVPFSTEHCNRRGKNCKTITQRWTYAIPLEIIYMTPLSKWNPYDIDYKGENETDPIFKSVKLNERDGTCTKNGSRALNGANSKLYYITPSEFYNGDEVKKDLADTSKASVCVLDKKKVQHKCRSAGTRIFIPNVKGVGIIRQRYPVMPIYGEGEAVWKELNALRAYVMDNETRKQYAWDSEIRDNDEHQFEMSLSKKGGSPHTHTITLSSSEYNQARSGVSVTVTTTLNNAHQHDLQVRFNKFNRLQYSLCNGKLMCSDSHPKRLYEVEQGDDVES